MQAKKKADIVFYFLLGGLYVYAISQGIFFTTILTVTPAALALFGLAMLLLFYLAFYNRWTALTFSIITLLITLWMVWRLWYAEVKFYLGEPLSFSENCYLFIRGYLPFDESYTPVVTFLITFFVAAFTALTLGITFNFIMLAGLGLGYFTVIQLLGHRIEGSAFIAFSICFLVFMIKRIQLFQTGSAGGAEIEQTPSKKFKAGDSAMIQAIPLCLLTIFLAWSIPAARPQARSVTGFLREFVYRVDDLLYPLFNPKYFNFQTTGFASRSGNLGGDVVLDGRRMMRVYGDKRVYLSGAVKDVYTGIRWNNSGGENVYYDDYPFHSLEHIESALALERFIQAKEQEIEIITESAEPLPGDNLFDINEFFVHEPGLELNNELLEQYDFWQAQREYRLPDENGAGEVIAQNHYLEVDIASNKTGTFFKPAKHASFHAATSQDVMTGPQGDLFARNFMAANTRYEYLYLEVDYASPGAQELLRNCYEGFYGRETINELNEDGSNQNLNGQWTLERYAGEMYARYTALPAHLPERVGDLARELTSGYDNDFDRIKALESYLAQFPYNLQPGDPARGQDFVDYFLFDGQEGYCTYYASALAVMSRTLGIPSRYVEGYALPYSKTEDGYFEVTNQNAHAWAEIYFEGFGWAPFEATAAFHDRFYSDDIIIITGSFSGSMMDPYYEEYMMMLLGYNTGAFIMDYDLFNLGNDELQFTNPIPFFFLIIGICILFVLALLSVMIYRRVRIGLFYRRVNKLEPNAQVMAYYKSIMKMTDYYRYPLDKNETPMEYARRIGKRFTFSNERYFMRDIINIYYKARYGQYKIPDEALELVRNAHWELLRYIRAMRIKITYVFHRYIRGTF